MDGSRFDDLTRALALSRRGALKHLLAGIVGGAGGLLGIDVTGAQGCEPPRRRCAADADCCSGACDPASGRCVCGAGTEECGGACLPLDQYQSDVDNCGGCRNRCRRADECQVPACIDGACGGIPDPDVVGEPCSLDGGVCGADGTCACPPDRPTACRRGCADTLSDPDNCGACDNRCRSTAHGTAVCAGGVCGIACDAGYGLCGERCCADDRECCNGDCCGPNDCCAAEGCVPCRCDIGIESYDAGEVNPEHACQYCDPTRDRDDWTISDDGTFCGEGRVCCNGDCCSPTECCDGVQCTSDACPDQCEIQGQPFEADEVNPANACQVCNPDRNRFDWTLVDDQTPCGGVPGRVCCNGECCSPTECCNPTGFCEECGPHCRIGGEDVDEGTVNPANPCEVCKPEVNAGDWSSADDDTDCGTGQFCCAGECCPPDQCCNDGECGPCRCEIGGQEYDRDVVNPFNACEVCNPERDRDDWSPGPNNAACGLTDGRFCCEGQCCPAGECCNDVGECEACPCRINGQDVVDGGVNPSNTCQVCDVDENREDWTVLGDGEACGADGDDRVCCGGACCPQGQCCEGGTCQDCGCEINGVSIAPETINEANSCLICDPSRSRLDWSPVDSDTPCGAGGNQRCCGGECCAEDQCCLLEACGECLCAIGGVNYAAETPNPENACEVCKPDEDPFGWSTVDDDTSCGDDRVCCAGTCCEPGLCCNLGVCQFCGCRIGDQEVAEFAINPENECEWCDPVLDPFAWSPRSDTPCGSDQVCCGGVCCAEGECCGLDDVCGSCPCLIDDQSYDDGAFNPENPCEICDPSQNAIDWTLSRDNSLCGNNPDLVCCRGVCCASEDHCCLSDGTCGRCVCTIEDQEFAAAASNPANACEICNPFEDHTGWTLLDDGSFCGDTFDQVCCAGVCCPSGQCCLGEPGTCQPCGCEIDGVAHDAGALNPDNTCEVCDPSQSESTWSVASDHAICGDDLNRICCNGVCCPDGTCCRSGFDFCSIEWCGFVDPCEDLGRCGCTIDGVFYPHETINPANECQWCHAYFSTTSWYNRGDFASCGPNGDQYCCSEVCCELGACCNDSEVCEFGSPFCKGCVITGRFYRHLQKNPDNPCELCNADLNPAFWSNAENHRSCGPMIGDDGTYWGELLCCEGVCCTEWYTCCRADGTCGQGPCPDW